MKYIPRSTFPCFPRLSLSLHTLGFVIISSNAERMNQSMRGEIHVRCLQCMHNKSSFSSSSGSMAHWLPLHTRWNPVLSEISNLRWKNEEAGNADNKDETGAWTFAWFDNYVMQVNSYLPSVVPNHILQQHWSRRPNEGAMQNILQRLHRILANEHGQKSTRRSNLDSSRVQNLHVSPLFQVLFVLCNVTFVELRLTFGARLQCCHFLLLGAIWDSITPWSLSIRINIDFELEMKHQIKNSIRTSTPIWQLSVNPRCQRMDAFHVLLQ